MPRIERLQQNTAEWHRWRQQGLGASDAPVIMGEAAFRNARMITGARRWLSTAANDSAVTCCGCCSGRGSCELSGCTRTRRSGTVGDSRGSAPAMLRSSWVRRLSRPRACCGR